MSAIRYGVKNYVLKPVDLDELTECIQNVRTELDTEQAAYLKQEKLTQTCSKIEDLLTFFRR